jgi:SHS2 domain-containing protein
MEYKILDHITTADIAYEVYGKTIEELFINAAKAVTETMVDMATVKPSQKAKWRMQNGKLEDLLLDFLNELIYYKDSKKLLFSRFEIKIEKNLKKGYCLRADLWGEKIDPKKHQLRTDVKAATMHKLSLGKQGKTYKAVIVLDI